ncbi:MAG: hypothetical protein ACRDBX_02340 [Erysipelotrichaceae bacterium]
MLVKICENCSGIFKEDILKASSDVEVKTGCLAHCNQHQGKVFGFINYKLVIEDNKEAFLKHIITQ